MELQTVATEIQCRIIGYREEDGYRGRLIQRGRLMQREKRCIQKVGTRYRQVKITDTQRED